MKKNYNKHCSLMFIYQLSIENQKTKKNIFETKKYLFSQNCNSRRGFRL
jgi:hypothetical protein